MNSIALLQFFWGPAPFQARFEIIQEIPHLPNSLHCMAALFVWRTENWWWCMNTFLINCTARIQCFCGRPNMVLWYENIPATHSTARLQCVVWPNENLRCGMNAHLKNHSSAQLQCVWNHPKHAAM